jgi:hypothetical protein
LEHLPSSSIRQAFIQPKGKSSMPLIRGHHAFDDHFTQVPNAWLRDPNLSLGAKGLLAQLLSHAPGWEVSQESLAKANRIGKDAIRKLIGELLGAGYLNRSTDRTRTDKGYLSGYVYTTQDPDPSTAVYPTLDNPTLDNPTLDNPPLKKNILKEQQTKEEQLKENPQTKFEEEFSKFWNLYPRRTEKVAAFNAFCKASQKYGLDVIMAGVVNLANDPNLPPKTFIPYPASWLNAGGWTNEPYPERQVSPEEKAAKLAEERKRKALQDQANTKRLFEEMKQSEAKAAPPPKCTHGNSLLSCLPCLRQMSD